MINIRTYKQYWEEMVVRIDDLKSSLVVATEQHLGKKVKDIKDYPTLVAVVPSSDPDSLDPDNVKEKNSGLIFVLIKTSSSNRTDENYIDDMELTQQIMKEIKENMLADHVDSVVPCASAMKHLDVNSFHQDPEYNYLGHDGWSLSFQFTSIGL